MQQLASTGLTVLLLVAALVVLGVAMVWLAVWLTRSTRTDAPALGPLEAMGTRRFHRGDEAARTARLADARPDGAPVPAPIVAFEDLPVGGAADDPEEEEQQVETEHAEQPGEGAAEHVDAMDHPAEVDPVEPSATPVDDAPPRDEPTPDPTAESPNVAASVLTAPSPLELETDEDEPVAERLEGARVEEPR